MRIGGISNTLSCEFKMQEEMVKWLDGLDGMSVKVKFIDEFLVKDIIEGRDIIENPLPVFTVVGGKLVESVTDKYGYPNCDDQGYTMYENTHFPTKEQAIDYGIKEYEAGVSIAVRKIVELKEKLQKSYDERDTYQQRVNYLKTLKTE